MEKQDKKNVNPWSKIIVGFYLILGGILAFGKNTGIVEEQMFSLYFSAPAIFTVLGLIIIANSTKKVFGIIFTSIGLLLFFVKYLGYSASIGNVWFPAILLIIGIILIFRPMSVMKIPRINKNNLQDINIFSGSKRSVTESNFRGGSIISIFGGAEHDFTQAQLKDNKVNIDVVAIFGGCKLFIPPDWNVKIEVTSILGAFMDKRTIVSGDYEKAPEITIRGIVIFGGGEIYS